MSTRRLLLCTAAAAVSSCAGNQNVFNPAGPAARSIASLGWFLFGVSGVVYVLVLLALAWALMRRRRASDDLPETEQRLARAVIAAVAATVVILLTFTAASVWAGRGLTSPSGPGAVTVEVIGHQWWWEFRYGDVSPSEIVTSPNELHIPVGVPVVLKAASRDVIHSFWVPNLHGKRDLIPGVSTQFWIQADREGVYRGQCAEFCGHEHALMAFTVVAESRQAFRQWLEGQRQPAAQPATELALQGQQRFLQAPCVMCHTVRGTSAGARLGPDLTHVASRRTLAAGTLPNTRGHLAGWVLDPQAVKPGTRMPITPLSSADLQAVVAYLRELR